MDEVLSRCPACGDYIDYCQGHGEIGDPAGYAILRAHDDDDHQGCNPDACEAAVQPRCSHAINSDCPHYS